MVEAILREPAGKCQKLVSEAMGSQASVPAVRRHPAGRLHCEQDAREPPTGMSALQELPKPISGFNQRTQITRLHD